MASKILKTTLQNWYTKINSILDRGAKNTDGTYVVSKLTVPSSPTTIKRSEINQIFSTVDAMKRDASYMGSVSSIYTEYSYIDSTGAIQIKESKKNEIDTLLTSLDQIQCRNTATNSKGSNSNEYYGHESKSNGTWTITDSNHSQGGYDTSSNKWWNHGSHLNGHSSGSHSNESHSNTKKTNGTCTQGTVIDILNSHSTKSNA